MGDGLVFYLPNLPRPSFQFGAWSLLYAHEHRYYVQESIHSFRGLFFISKTAGNGLLIDSFFEVI